MFKTSLLSVAVLCGTVLSANAVVLAEASFDTSSYIYSGSSYSTRTTISVSQENKIWHEKMNPPQWGYHFNFGVIEFDVSGLSLDGNKYLALTPEKYTMPTEPGQPEVPPSLTGSASVHVIALDASFSTYNTSSKSKWFDTRVEGGEVVGTINFKDQGTFYLDVTTIVNSWISNDRDNYGFALWSSEGSVEIYSSESGFGPQLTSVPEPSTYALFAGIAVLLGTMIYRKRK